MKRYQYIFLKNLILKNLLKYLISPSNGVLMPTTHMQQRLHRLKEQSLVRLPLCQTGAALGCPHHSHFRSTGCQFGGFHCPLRSNNSLESLTKLRKMLCIYNYTFIIANGDKSEPERHTEDKASRPRDTSSSWRLDRLLPLGKLT